MLHGFPTESLQLVSSSLCEGHRWSSLQLRKVKDVPRLLHRLRTTLGSVDIRDFSLLLDRYSFPHGAQGQRLQRQRKRVPPT